MYKRLGPIMLAVVAALGIAACSPPGESPSDQPPGAEQQPTALEGVEDVTSSGSKTASTSPKSSGEAACTADDFEVTGSFGEQPSVSIPDGCAAPGELLTEDLVAGEGAAATGSSTLEVRYQLVTFSGGKVVDGNFGGQPLSVPNLGQAQLIEGWKQGLVGIKEGGRRLLVVPPELGYGASGSGEIGPNETLVFVVDAVSVQPA